MEISDWKRTNRTWTNWRSVDLRVKPWTYPVDWENERGMTLEILGKILAVFDRVFNIVSLIILPLNFFLSNSILSPDNILTNIVFWSVRHPSLLVYMLVTCQKSQKLNQKNTFWPYDLARFCLQVSRLCNFSFNLNFLIRRSWCHLNNPIKSRFYFPRSERPKIWPTTLLWKFPFWFLYLANIDPEYNL